MPELPEVETIRRGLEKVLPGRKITSLVTRRAGMRIPFPPHLPEAVGCKILSVGRRAKYLLIRLDNGSTMIMHLGMSGRLLVRDKNAAPREEKHDHMVIMLDDKTQITLNDPRRFGLVDLCKTADIESHRFFRHLGPEPFDKKFGAAYLAEKLKGKKIAVKLAIMDQRLVVGVGNIYAAEALFAAGIHPSRPCRSLTGEEIGGLAAGIRSILKKAIAAGGSSLRDYVQTDGELGYFQHHWAVYGREGQKCGGCSCNIRKTGGVKRLTQGGRSTFYCPVKQS
jgi:formamidopyrimidine-DNA glycosylase